ncbi:hypothetical protein TeGR_g8725 [Tetraparma gracilis]|uniref:GMP phosphodiesterase delta subunit domain-containing protein n=1 Tax=Tetraparma gracilis TaxID=2962635 RepID=A0ABQ6N872_9STRA|nr:hypothetical protein TeGR_g8725 [Tetraparma gracilis]
MPVTPDDVLEFRKPSASFLCPVSANTYGIEFLSFVITDYETKKTIFEVGKDVPPVGMEMDVDLMDENSFRKIKYTFSEDVLRLPLIGTTLVFKVGDQNAGIQAKIETAEAKRGAGGAGEAKGGGRGAEGKTDDSDDEGPWSKAGDYN